MYRAWNCHLCKLPPPLHPPQNLVASDLWWLMLSTINNEYKCLPCFLVCSLPGFNFSLGFTCIVLPSPISSHKNPPLGSTVFSGEDNVILIAISMTSSEGGWRGGELDSTCQLMNCNKKPLYSQRYAAPTSDSIKWSLHALCLASTTTPIINNLTINFCFASIHQ